MYYFICNLVRYFIKLFYRVQVIGREHLPTEKGYVIACNHTGWLDILSLASVAAYPVKVNYMAKKELFSNRFFKWFFESIKAFPVDREKPGPSSLKIPIRLLRAGEVVGIFPSGTRTQEEEAPLKRGAVFLSEKAKVPLVPAIYFGPPVVRFTDLFRRKTITIIFGEPLDPEQHISREDRNAFLNVFNKEFARLNEEAQRYVS